MTTDRAALAFMLTLQRHHADTGEHSRRVARLARRLGEELGLLPVDLDNLADAALLHDIGKVGVERAILDKAGWLTDGEWAQLRAHAWAGAEMVRPLYPEAVCLAVAQHHERWDGTGYPAGLSGEEITLLARVVAVVDTYDAITCDRAYRRGAPHAVALHEIAQGVGTQFDPNVVEAFLRIPREELNGERLTAAA